MHRTDEPLAWAVLLWAEGTRHVNELGRQTAAGTNGATQARVNSSSEAGALCRALGWADKPPDPSSQWGTHRKPAQQAGGSAGRKGTESELMLQVGNHSLDTETHVSVLAWAEPMTTLPWPVPHFETFP